MLHPSPLSAALPALLLGLALGALYDILRPPRRAMRRCAFLADLAFCFAAAFGAFCLAMRDGCGRFGLWSVAAGFAGFAGWINAVSPRFLPAAERVWAFMVEIGKFIRKNIKKSLKLAKFLFAKCKSCFIISSVKKADAQGECP